MLQEIDLENDENPYIKLIKMEESTGFEPVDHISMIDCLANNWFKPLTQLSE